MSDIKLAVAGIGNWGKHLVRNYHDMGVLYACCDVDAEKLEKAKKAYNVSKITTNFDQIVSDPEIDAVVIASPAVYHYEMAKKSLEEGKATYVEKPMALKASHCQELVDISKKNDTILMVGHLMLYHPALAQIKGYIDNGDLGDIYYSYSLRVNLGTVRKDENSLWSFAPHDISVMLYLLTVKSRMYQQGDNTIFRKILRTLCFCLCISKTERWLRYRSHGLILTRREN